MRQTSAQIPRLRPPASRPVRVFKSPLLFLSLSACQNWSIRDDLRSALRLRSHWLRSTLAKNKLNPDQHKNLPSVQHLPLYSHWERPKCVYSKSLLTGRPPGGQLFLWEEFQIVIWGQPSTHICSWPNLRWPHNYLTADGNLDKMVVNCVKGSYTPYRKLQEYTHTHTNPEVKRLMLKEIHRAFIFK